MRTHIKETVEIPSGVSCNHTGGTLTCTKGSISVQRIIVEPQIIISLKGNEIVIECKKGNRSDRKEVMSLVAHVKNLFRGLDEPYAYKLEAVNVHFPMTMKIESDKLVINNFLGEKTPRHAVILKGAKVELKGNQLTVSSPSRELAGQTAANIEKATIVRGRDRRIFQDGIYITQKPGRDI